MPRQQLAQSSLPPAQQPERHADVMDCSREQFQPNRYYDTHEIASRLFPRVKHPRKAVSLFIKRNQIPCYRTAPRSLTRVLGQSILDALTRQDQQARAKRAERRRAKLRAVSA
jgi:hypothetical protein